MDSSSVARRSSGIRGIATALRRSAYFVSSRRGKRHRITRFRSWVPGPGSVASVTGRGGEVASVTAIGRLFLRDISMRARRPMSESSDVRIHDIQVADTEAYLVEPVGGGRGSGDRSSSTGSTPRRRTATGPSSSTRPSQPGARARDGLDPAAGPLPVVERTDRRRDRTPSASGPRSTAIAPALDMLAARHDVDRRTDRPGRPRLRRDARRRAGRRRPAHRRGRC